MSIVGVEDMKVRAKKVPKWESELWSCVSKGKGMYCPLKSHCPIIKSGKWCADNVKLSLERLVDYEQFNLSDYDSIEPIVDNITCRMGKMVEMLAQQCLKKSRIRSPPVPTEIISLADDQYPVEVRVVALKAYHGAIWHPKDGWVIQLKADDTSGTKKFTLFHEAFHILAHCRTTPVFRKRGVGRGSFNELLADYFAMCILMPQEWVKEKWTKVKNLDKMAEIFDVPKSLMCIRLRRLDLI